MKIFIISMKSYKERREFQIRQAKQLNLNITFIDAINGADLSTKELQNAANQWTRPIFSKDVGFFLSHRKAWEEVRIGNNKCLILEDDVVISKEINKIIDVVEGLKDSWNTVYDLEYAPGYHLLSKQSFYSEDNNLLNIREIYQNKTGLAAYILGPQLALKMLEEFKNYVMVDAAFWSRSWAQYMQVEPAPAIQMMHLGKETRQDEYSIKNVRDENFVNKSWLSRKFKRLQISFYELPSFIKGLINCNKRKLIFDKDELAFNFDFLIDKKNKIN